MNEPTKFTNVEVETLNSGLHKPNLQEFPLSGYGTYRAWNSASSL